MSTSISNNVQNIGFQTNSKPKLISVKDYPGYKEGIYEAPVSTGKKVGVGLASFLIPGLGQGVNNQWWKAAGFFFGGVLASLACKFSGAYAYMQGKSKSFAVAIIASIIANIGIRCLSAMDSVKNAKQTIVKIVPNDINTDSLNHSA